MAAVSKTFVGVRKALQLTLLNPGTDGIITEPSHPLLVQILIPEMHAALQQFKLEYTYKSSEKIFYVKVGTETNRIICASMESTDRLIGVNASFVIADEFDTSKMEVAYDGFLRLLGRLRAGNIRQFVIISTPEGFSAMYKIFVQEKDKHHARLIRAKTTDNFFLPLDFINTMMGSYTIAQQKAYLNGEFVNLTNASIFDFDRRVNHASIDINASDRDIYFGCDFNYSGSVTLAALFIEEEIYIFAEHITKNTFETRDLITLNYPGKEIWIAADASGSKNTSNATQTDLDILDQIPKSAFIQGARNPMVQDSILSVNAALRGKKIWIDTNKCPRLTEALEQHVYNKSGEPEKFRDHPAIDDFTDAIRYLTWTLSPVKTISWATYQNY